MPEIDPLVLSYSHLADFPRAKEALQILKKVASLVKPIMRARGWKVKQLTEFYPQQYNLLGLNYGAGQKICLRLRYPGDRNQFLPIEQVTDTMLHELSHNVHGPHDAKFHALWNQLRDEHEALTMKGYTGEGFLSEGHRLGGRRRIPMHEARRLARAAAEKRRSLSAGSGQRVGGARPRPDQDIRRTIVNAVERRLRTLRGCANDDDHFNEDQRRNIADTATRNGFKTQAEEDAANEAAIAQALWELVQEEEKAKYGDSYIPPSAADPTGSGGGAASAGPSVPPPMPARPRPPQKPTGEAGRAGKPAHASTPTTWECGICTLENPVNYLCCDACGAERGGESKAEYIERTNKRPRTKTVDLTRSDTTPKRRPSSSIGRGPAPSAETARAEPPTWQCSFCGRIRERMWWSCDLCGKIKESSR